MNESDALRLKDLMAHYKQPYTSNHALLRAERLKYEDCEIPDNKHVDREINIEWEGPFFCRIISELLETKKLKGYCNG